MPRWLSQVLSKIRELAAARSVRITDKARREIERLDLGLDREDVCDLLAQLGVGDFSERVAFDQTGEWLFVFKPVLAGATLYVKLIVRADCIVVSFHEDEPDEE